MSFDIGLIFAIFLSAQRSWGSSKVKILIIKKVNNNLYEIKQLYYIKSKVTNYEHGIYVGHSILKLLKQVNHDIPIQI